MRIKLIVMSLAIIILIFLVIIGVMIFNLIKQSNTQKETTPQNNSSNSNTNNTILDYNAYVKAKLQYERENYLVYQNQFDGNHPIIP